MARMFNGGIGAIIGAVIGITIGFAATGDPFPRSFAFAGDIVALLAAVFCVAGFIWGDALLHEIVESLPF